MIGKGYNDEDIVVAIATGLDNFYTQLIQGIDALDIKKIMSRKNPYLYRAKAMSSAAQIIDSVLAATVSSSEETIFGTCFFEPVATAASGGQKALAEGIDVMIQHDEINTIYAVAVKSGPNVFNNDSRKKQEQNFNAAARLAQQVRARYVPIIGYGYGKKRTTGRGRPKPYIELAGKRFWAELTGEDDFYLQILRHMGMLPEEYLEQFTASYDRAANRLVREFSNMFCLEDGSIDWDALVEFNSGD